MPKKWTEPNRADPLSEPTLNRRLWATYLAAGYTRADFARAIGVRYNVVSNWDTGKHVISAALLVRCADVLDCSIDALAYGHAGRPAHRLRSALTWTEVNALCADMNATPAECFAFAKHVNDDERGQIEHLTPAYVTQWLTTLRAELGVKGKGKRTPEQAAASASEAARNALNREAAVAGGRTALALPTAKPTATAASVRVKPRVIQRKRARLPTARPN